MSSVYTGAPASDHSKLLEVVTALGSFAFSGGGVIAGTGVMSAVVGLGEATGRGDGVAVAGSGSTTSGVGGGEEPGLGSWARAINPIETMPNTSAGMMRFFRIKRWPKIR